MTNTGSEAQAGDAIVWPAMEIPRISMPGLEK